MHRILKTISLMMLAALLPSVAVAAQDSTSSIRTVKMDSVMLKLNYMTVDDYMNIELPPLEVLFENAKKSPEVMYYNYEAEYYRRDITTERLKFLEWIRAVGTYSYGNTDLAAISLMETTYQIWTQNQSSQTNMYFNIGATVAIPLSEIFNYNNRIQKAKAKKAQTEARFESEWNLIKREIIEQYFRILELIPDFKAATEMKVVAQAQYHFAENDFVNNISNSEELYRSKNYETGAIMDLERTRRELNTALLTLEIISHTPIVSNMQIAGTR